MAPSMSLEISIPTTSDAYEPKPHTLYIVSLRLPLRTFTLSKRYSDFTTLHGELTSQAGGTPPPLPLPPKNYLRTTYGNPTLIEERRAGLERYLREINGCEDGRWRDTSVWRTFLNLPTSLMGKTGSGPRSGAADSLHATLTLTASAPTAAVTDPVVWLDTHRELKGHLRNARATLAARDAGRADASAADTHDASAQAKKELVKAAGLLGTLERGLREHGAEWGARKLGEGEVRRRKDLIAAARKDVDALEDLVKLVRKKGEVDGVVEGMSAGNGASGSATKDTSVAPAKSSIATGRVLGKETARTRELDNKGVLELQQQMIQEQDEDVDVLAQAVRRQKELGLQIQQELEAQNEMLGLFHEDLNRVEGKLKVARKRVDKIN